MTTYRKGDTLTWSWGQGEASGTVVEVFTDRVEKQIDLKVTRNADDDNPAYLLEQEDGDRVLKSLSELTKD